MPCAMAQKREPCPRKPWAYFYAHLVAQVHFFDGVLYERSKKVAFFASFFWNGKQALLAREAINRNAYGVVFSHARPRS